MKKFSEYISKEKEPWHFPKTAQKSMYILTYQGTSHLYAKMNLKVELVELLLKAGASNFMSYTDSTILFEAKHDKTQYLRLMVAIETAVGIDLKPRFYYTLAGIIRETDGTNIITVRRDQDLNEHFQNAIAHLLKKED